MTLHGAQKHPSHIIARASAHMVDLTDIQAESLRRRTAAFWVLPSPISSSGLLLSQNERRRIDETALKLAEMFTCMFGCPTFTQTLQLHPHLPLFLHLL